MHNGSQARYGQLSERVSLVAQGSYAIRYPTPSTSISKAMVIFPRPAAQPIAQLSLAAAVRLGGT